MTSIKISGSYEELKIIESSSTEIFRENVILAKTQIAEFRTDSIEVEQVLPVLSVTFSGVIAIVQIVKLILNIQERKSKITASEDTPISIKIEASNGKELDLKISGDITNAEIKELLNSVQQFVDDFLREDDGISLENSRLEGAINSTDIEKLNLLFRDLLSNLIDIRELKSLPPKKDGEVTIFESTFDKTDLREFIYESRERKIYLHYEEATACKSFFYILERENILSFHEISTDFRMVDMDNIFVRYKTEELSLFNKIIHHKNFILNRLSAPTVATNQSDIISILMLSADPSDASRLRLGEEFREVQDKLQLAKLRERFRLDQRMSVRPIDISQSLLDLQPQIVHFSGHGLASGELCFEDQIGRVHPVSPDAVAALFEQFSTQVKCVLLNACYSEVQAVAIVRHIDYVIGMDQAIGDKAAIAFAIGFYQALGAGRTFREAYKLGCVQIRLQGIPEHLTPIFLERSK
jgi:hypothetical protein